MKRILMAFFLLISFNCFAEDETIEWKETTLTDETISKIQMAKHEYIKCISRETESRRSVEMDSRAATDEIIKACETELSKIRNVFIAQKVPEPMADRYLKKSRTETARNVLKEMMFAAAARKMGR